MTEFQTVDDVFQELKLMLSQSETGYDTPIKLDDAIIRDYARIGSLMSDTDACCAWLARLNSELVQLANDRQLRKKQLISRKPKMKLKKASFSYTAHSGERVSGKVRQHDNILKTYLAQWEVTQGFNTGSKEGGLPSRAPLLTGWVQPPDFRKYLLKHGFHWNDIGVAENHGEFTHRLHWYIICSQANAAPTWLTHPPLDLFKLCGDEDRAVNSKAKANGTIWDRLFDHLGDEVRDGPAKGSYIGFRKAENLHAFLRMETSRKRQDLWALAQIIHSRASRVALINSLGQVVTTKRLDFDLAQRQAGQADRLQQVGDITQKIVWQKIQQNDAEELLNEFLN